MMMLIEIVFNVAIGKRVSRRLGCFGEKGCEKCRSIYLLIRIMHVLWCIEITLLHWRVVVVSITTNPPMQSNA